jgi:DUF1680 family protein
VRIALQITTAIVLTGLVGISFSVDAAGVPSAADLAPTPVVTNRAPLLATPFVALPLGDVRAQGWLLTQCQLQREGLTGHAETLYADDIGTNSAWLGGTGDAWERSPYYFKGLIALAYTLNDDGLKKKAQKWMDWLLNNQGRDGYLGPKQNNDWWPRMVATYAARDYYEATGDARVPTVLSNYFHYMLAELPARPLADWGKARAGDEIDTVFWMYNRNGDTNLLALAKLLHEQADDWNSIYTSNNFMLYGTDYQPKHNVNVEEALKFPAVYHQVSGDPDDDTALTMGWNNLMREHGLSCGINSGTEFISGNASVQGVELCAIVEAMLSLETAVRITGDPVLADRLETISFNALPAALTSDIKGLQYYTQPNNVIAIEGGHGFNQDYRNATLPGPYSGYPCCRYNFHMGWPKFVQNSWAATSDGGLALITYAPTVVNALAGGRQVQITEDTDYPFEEQVRLHIAIGKRTAFPLVVRIPGWCSNAVVTVNDHIQPGVKTGSFYSITRTWKNGDAVTIDLPMPIQTLTGPSRSVAINRGPLVYSLKIGEQWKVHTPDPLKTGFDEFEIHPTTPWNYALQLDQANPAASLGFTRFPLPTNPFDPAQLSTALFAHARQLPNWTIGWRGTQAFEPPVSPAVSTNPLTTVMLVPFGSQHLRISWFPYLGTPSPITGSFTEDFDSTWSQRWTVFGGNWLARLGTLRTVPGSANGTKAMAMATSFTNFTCEADVSVGDVGDAGLIFRASKPDIGTDAYCGYYAGISVQNSKVEFGCISNSWHELASVPMSFTPDKSYHLKIQAQGSHLIVFVGDNAHPVVDLHDDHFSSGMVGVRDFCADGDKSISSFSKFAVHELALGPE